MKGGNYMEKETGLVHIYYGDGKGKTTTGMGLCVRAAGYGYRVLIYQFMKNNKTSERKILEQVPNITLENGLETEKFSFQMTPEEKQERRAFYGEQFQKMTEKAVKEQYDLLFLDETIYTITAGLLDEELVLKFLREKPENLEVILTGNTPSPQLIELADYVSEIKKVKHPFDKGQRARKGIEK
jgi:cob(I)alamin adenosyltransferase